LTRSDPKKSILIVKSSLENKVKINCHINCPEKKSICGHNKRNFEQINPHFDHFVGTNFLANLFGDFSQRKIFEKDQKSKKAYIKARSDQ